MSSTRSGWTSEPRFASRWIRVATAVLVVVVLGAPIGSSSAGPVDRVGDSSPARPAADDVAATPPDVLPADGSWTVTLLTGDVLDVRSDADGRVTALARDRTGPIRTVRMPDGDLYVIPLAVTPLVERVLDLELFNVTGLIRQGYDDASIDVVPLIVQRQPGVDVEARLSTSDDEQPLPSIDAVATDVPKADAEATGELLAELAAALDAQARSAGGITRVWLDRQVTTLSADSPIGPSQAPADLDPNLTQVGADRAWAAGFTGEGVTVAVLDTGVDGQHPDLAGQVVAEANFSSSEDAVDRFGHGTHVASIVAGTGAAAAGTRSGVAPDARLISGKVVDDFGFGFESEAIAGMEWAAPQADVVNMSLGYGLDSDGSDPISLALDTLTELHDTLFVVAAGNSGPLSRSVEFPGAADRALTVGAVDTRDMLAEFSSRGPLTGSFELKPEVVAPGVDIVAARAAGTTMGEPVDDLYTRASGTSMATPHAAGAAAALAQQHPGWDADQLKVGLVGSADPVDGDGYDIGAGRLDIGDGVDAAVRAERDVVDVPLADPRSEPHEETLTWTNTGDTPQTVTLDADLEDRRGDEVDAVSVEPAQLTLAPGVTGTATLRVDGPELEPGLYSGMVTADPTGDADQDDLRTPVAVHAEAEMVDLTIEATAPGGVTGLPASFAAIVNLDDFGELGEVVFFEDTTTLPVPVGRYSVVGDVSSQDRDAQAVAQVGDPDIEITEDTTVSFDGAGAVPFRPTVAGVETAPPLHTVGHLVVTPSAGTGGFGLVLEVFTSDPMPAVRLAPMQGDPAHFVASQIFRLQAPHLVVRVGDQVIEALPPRASPLLDEGDHTLTAVDAGDGSDLSGARGQLAVVRLPADPVERAAVTQRALDAGVGLLAFVDEQRGHLTLDAFIPERWAVIPSIAVAGESATSLLAAAAAGKEATVTVAASPYVYDIVTPDAAEVDPEPVITRSERHDLARIDQRFHRDSDGTGPDSDRRYPISVTLIANDSHGPLPERRTDYVTPGVTWQSIVIGPGFLRIGEVLPVDAIALSMDAGATYEPGSRTTLDWLRRPQWPGPVGGPLGASGCQPTPVLRTPDTLQVWVAPFQDGRDRFGCADPHTSTLTLERDGTVIGTVEEYFAEFAVPPEPGTYRLSYEQAGQGPYQHRSTTTWTFRSAAPGDATGGDEPVPLLVVDYDLPLDTLNRPTGRTATFTVDQVTGTDGPRIRSLRVWTSTDGGASWQRASADDRDDGEFRVRLPRVDRGTAVSLRVDAEDRDGNRIEQTLHDAYTA
ncbi:MAG: S8 family peptidase [Acidimicrobiales bacterium]